MHRTATRFGLIVVCVLFLSGEPCRSSVNWGQLSTLTVADK